MAAIIAQISLQAAKRRRETFKRIPIEKSNAVLPPFDQHFEPKSTMSSLKGKLGNLSLKCKILEAKIASIII